MVSHASIIDTKPIRESCNKLRALQKLYFRELDGPEEEYQEAANSLLALYDRLAPNFAKFLSGDRENIQSFKEIALDRLDAFITSLLSLAENF